MIYSDNKTSCRGNNCGKNTFRKDQNKMQGRSRKDLIMIHENAQIEDANDNGIKYLVVAAMDPHGPQAVKKIIYYSYFRHYQSMTNYIC